MSDTLFPGKYADAAESDLVRTAPPAVDPEPANPAQSTQTRAYGALISNGPIHAMTMERRALLPDDIAIEALYCGVPQDRRHGRGRHHDFRHHRGFKSIWTKKPETASRVRMRIEAVLNSSKALGWRSGENPAIWKGGLHAALPRSSKIMCVRHHPAMPWETASTFMIDLKARAGMGARAVDQRLPSLFMLFRSRPGLVGEGLKITLQFGNLLFVRG
ncbi:MAG: phage integrase central domain-containing protein [Novosphingobium sp.]